MKVFVVQYIYQYMMATGKHRYPTDDHRVILCTDHCFIEWELISKQMSELTEGSEIPCDTGTHCH